MTTKTAIRAFFQQGLLPDSLLYRYFDHILFTTDNERHRGQHEIFERVLVPRFKGLYPRVKAIAGAVFFKALRTSNPVEIVSQCATLVPINVICDWMGIGPEYFDQLRSWTEAANTMLDPFRPLPVQAQTGRAFEKHDGQSWI